MVMEAQAAVALLVAVLVMPAVAEVPAAKAAREAETVVAAGKVLLQEIVEAAPVVQIAGVEAMEVATETAMQA